MKRILLATLLVLIAIAQVPRADFIHDITNPLAGSFCSSFFSQSPSGPLASVGGYASMLSISLLIVVAVLMVLGIVYAFGMAFKVDSLRNFAKSEYLESVFNIALIVAVAGGLGFAGSAISVISNIGLAGTQALIPSNTAAQAVQVSSVYQVYSGICTNYVTNGISIYLNNMITMVITTQLLMSAGSWTISLMPGGNGVSFSPLMGVGPLIGVITTQATIFGGMTGLLLMVTFLLYIIYMVFPVFLYAGLLLRSFPWTRAAGGSFIALFIAFYIVFPAILYPFSIYIGSYYSALGVQSGFSTVSLNALTGVITVLLGQNGGAILAEVDGFAQTACLAALQLMGVVIGFIICFDLVEAIGKLLGAPSVHTRNLLSKLL